MTNREWLNTLSNEEFLNWLFNDFERDKYKYNSSYLGIKQWLEEEYKER